MWPAVVAGLNAAYTAQHLHLQRMTPEQRAAWRARRDMETILARSMAIQKSIEEQRQAFLARLEAAPEVMLARQYIADEALQGDHAGRLLTFARDLALRRGAAS